MQKSCAIVLAAALVLDLNYAPTAFSHGGEKISSTPGRTSGRTSARSVKEQRTIPQLPPAPQPSSGGLDVCFVMDCTGSMAQWITAAKTTIKDMIASLGDQEEHHRIAFVAYRDFQDGPPQVFDFTDNIDEVIEFIDGQRATGGGDIPEDVAGGLAAALGLSWKAETRSVVLVSDAPCHGREYAYSPDDHKFPHDDFPEGDPTGLSMKALTQSFRMAHIDFTFVQLTSETEVMQQQMRDAYEKTPKCNNNRRFELRDLREILQSSASLGAGPASPSFSAVATKMRVSRDSAGEEAWMESEEEAWLVEDSVPMHDGVSAGAARMLSAAVTPSLLAALESTRSGEAVPSMDVKTAYRSMSSDL